MKIGNVHESSINTTYTSSQSQVSSKASVDSSGGDQIVEVPVSSPATAPVSGASERSSIDQDKYAALVKHVVEENEEEVLKKSVEQANKNLKVFDRVIEREVHEKTKAVMYTIRDTKTKEIIAEFPPRKLQDMIAKMWELAGLFIDEKA